MMYAANKPVEASVSGLIGLSATLALLFLIELLSSMHPATDDLDQALVIDLAEWRPQPDTRENLPTDKTSKPVIKKIPKVIEHDIAEKTVAEETPPLPQPVVNNRAVQETEADVEDDALPVPIPLFKLTEIPRFLHQKMPEYPESMRSLGKTGRVTLLVLIDKSGRVRDINVLESDGEAFSQAAIEAVLASSFIPAKIDGNPVAVKLKLPITFKLL